jgi:hypothetical protein
MAEPTGPGTAAPSVRTGPSARIRFASRAFILAGLAAAVLGLGAASASAATVTAAAHSPAASQISFLPPDPCAPVVPPTPI